MSGLFVVLLRSPWFEGGIILQKLLALSLSVIMLFGVFMLPAEAFGAKANNGVDINDLWIRDPFILLSEGTYYLYGTVALGKNGYGCYTSTDLKTWYGPYCVFDADAEEGFDGAGDYWAAECHEYNGSFYLFASYRSKETGYRGTSVFKAASPLGPFKEISDGHITPHGTDSIDGTLYIEDGVPYMVYVQEHTSDPNHIGGMAYARLSEDLSHFVSEPVTIFKANSPFWADSDNSVTDGPFLYRTKSGELIMLWSTFDSGYIVATAFSSNGKIDGKWRHNSRALYRRNDDNKNDGGHAMLFTDKDGRLLLSMHSPNSGDTRIKLLEAEDNGSFISVENSSGIDVFSKYVDNTFYYMLDAFKSFIRDVIGSIVK